MDLELVDLKQVWAMLPSYNEEKRNGTWLIFKDCRTWVGMRTVTLEEHLANEYCIDLKELRHRTGSAVGNMRYMPLIFSRDRKFIQIHCRHPEFTYDGAYGIVRIDKIDSMVQGENQSIVTLKNEETITVLDTLHTLQTHCESVETAVKSLPHLQINIEDYHDLIFEEMEKFFKKERSEWH